MLSEEEKESLIARYRDLRTKVQLSSLDEQSDKQLLDKQRIDQLKERYKELKGKQEQREAAQKAWEESSAEEKSRLYASQALGSAEETVLEGVDLFVAPIREAGERLTGQEMRTLPQFAKDEFGIGANYVPEGIGRELADAAGALATVSAGMVNVARSGAKATDVILDIVGAGSSAGTRAAAQAQKTTDAILKSDAAVLGGDPVKWSTKRIADEAQAAANRIDIEENRAGMQQYEDYLNEAIAQRDRKAAKIAEETGRNFDEVRDELEIVVDEDIPQPMRAATLSKVYTAMAELGVPPSALQKALAKSGGLKFVDDFDELIDMDKPLAGSATGTGKEAGWFNRNLLPVADLIKRVGDRRVGALWERAVESSVRYTDQLAQRHVKPLESVVRQVNLNRDLKRLFLDLHRNPENALLIRKKVQELSGAPGVKALDNFMRDAGEQNTRAQKKLFKPDEGFDDQYYLHTQKVAKKAPLLSRPWRSAIGDETRMALRQRTRKHASEMSDAEIDEYENPLLSHIKFMGEQDQLIRMSETFGMRPALGMESSASDFFHEAAKHFQRNGLNEGQAGLSAQAMQEAFGGAMKAPPPYIRILMSQGYAGTLAQFKSAMLNLHDGFVAAFRMGGRNTLKALTKNMEAEFGKTLDELGMSNQGVGEFVKNFETTLSNPDGWDKAAKYTQNFTDGAMYVSGFKYMDKVGKGIVLRTAVEDMRKSAQKGTLAQVYGEAASKTDLQKIRPWLKKGVPAKDMPKDVAAIVEDLAFVQLGKQQLISYAGRPLGYLNNPMLRPAYAMTGFAIKQQAMLRDMIGQAWKAGDYAAAGQIAARYVAYAGVGYGLINETRSYVFKNEEFDSEDVAVGVVEQLGAAITFNRVGDEYSLRQIQKEGLLDFLMKSVIPPGGLINAASKDIATIISALYEDDPGVPDEVLQRVPALGDFYRYYYKKDKRSD
jgi:hypothetical protein